MTESKEAKPIGREILQALLDHIVADYKKPADLIGEIGSLKQLTNAVIDFAQSVNRIKP